MDQIVLDVQKLIADLESHSWFAAAADAGRLIADGIPFVQGLFVHPTPAKLQAHGPLTVDLAIGQLKSQLDQAQATGSFDWTKLLPMLVQLVQILLPLFAHPG